MAFPGSAVRASSPDEDSPLSLSVVIPCLDARDTLGVQLEALTAQSWPGWWEVIVADNGSTDGSRDLVRAFEDRISNLRLVDASDKRGEPHARNVGAAAARGDALLSCDADDEVAPGWLEAMGGALEDHDFVACRLDTEKLNPRWLWQMSSAPQRDGLNRYDYPPFLPHAGGGTLGVKRQLHEAVGGFDESFLCLCDTDYCWRLQLAGVELHFVPDAVVHIRYRRSLGGIFRQAFSYGEYNVKIYEKYRSKGMPHLGPFPGLARWAKLLLTVPVLFTRPGRGRWVWQAGWRMGRLRGCLEYGVAAL